MPDAGRTHGPPATKKQAAVTTGKAETTGIPCAMVLTAAPRSPRGSGLVGPRRLATIVSRGLSPASGGQDHTAWPSEKMPSSARKRALSIFSSTASRFQRP